MKRFSLLVCAFFLLASTLPAQKMAEVSLRYSRQEGIMRVVVEADETTLNGSSSIASPAVLHIDFTVPFEIRKTQDFPFEVSRKDRSLIITLKDITDIRVYKLSSPARIVAEMKLRPADVKQPAAQGANPPPKPIEKVSEQPAQQSPAPAATPAAGAPGSPQPASTVRTVVIDPGHGGYDSGLLGPDFREKDAALAIARDLGALLQKKGVRVFITRKADQPLSLAERISFTNSKVPDLFLSIHATTAASFSVTTGTMEEAGTDAVMSLYRLAFRQNRHIEKSRSVARSLAEIASTAYRQEATLRELPLPVLTSIDATAVLIEFPVGEDRKFSQKDREKLIATLMKGLGPREQ